MDDSYEDIFIQINNILEQIELKFLDKDIALKQLENIIQISQNRVDLYFDAMQVINSNRNKNILIYLK
jgi:hypothetical protein